MIRSTKIVRHLGVRLDLVADTITLDHQGRHRRRVTLTADGGLEFLLDLDRAVVMDDGDAMELEDGRLVQVKAAPEKMIEVTTFNPLRLMRAAWHLGNRHVPTEITPDAIYIIQDPVIESMLRGLGASTKQVVRPFKPERGAYEAALAHSQEGEEDHAAGSEHPHHHTTDVRKGETIAQHGPLGERYVEQAHHHEHDHDHAHGEGCGCGDHKHTHD